MTAHDPLCPQPCARCQLIAKSRADERERIAAKIEATRDRFTEWGPALTPAQYGFDVGAADAFAHAIRIARGES